MLYCIVKCYLHYDKDGRLMEEQIKESGDWAARVNRNTLRLGYCTGAWLVTTALATFGP